MHALWVAFVAAMTGVAAVTATAGPEPAIREGHPLPNWVLPSLADGRPVSLASFRGRRLLLQVFASW